MLRLDERQECGFYPPVTTYPRPRRGMTPEARPVWPVVIVCVVLLMCAAVAGARQWTIERLEAEKHELAVANAHLLEQLKRTDSESDGWEQRALDAENDLAITRDDLDALRASLTAGGVR